MPRIYLLAAFIAALATSPAAAQTCFRACLAPKLTASDIADDTIRAAMKQCRNLCEAQTLASQPKTLVASLDACEPAEVSDAEMKQVRRASPAPLAYAGAFAWDVHNVLEGHIIRRVELITQNMDLQDLVLSSRGTVLPGDTATILITIAGDGYPAVAVTSRIKAIYACPVP